MGIVVGDPDHVAELFKNLSDAGVDGFLLTWLDYEGGLARFGRELLPRLEKAGCAHRLQRWFDGHRADASNVVDV